MRSTIEAQEAEREWICLEVHDGMAQTMVSAFQHLQAYEAMPVSRLKEARPHILRAAALVRQAIGECREVINSITPAPLSELGLEATLRQELRRFEEDTGCSVQFNAPKTRLPREMEVALYRIVHEAVTNVKKHARSKSLDVEMHQERGRVSIRVKDSGVGFDPNLPQRSGRGLMSMRKRAEILGGVCEVKSQPGQGTEVIVDLPLLPGNGA
jgi:signal transduction histidine kinase